MAMPLIGATTSSPSLHDNYSRVCSLLTGPAWSASACLPVCLSACASLAQVQLLTVSYRAVEWPKKAVSMRHGPVSEAGKDMRMSVFCKLWEPPYAPSPPSRTSKSIDASFTLLHARTIYFTYVWVQRGQKHQGFCAARPPQFPHCLTNIFFSPPDFHQPSQHIPPLIYFPPYNSTHGLRPVLFV